MSSQLILLIAAAVFAVIGMGWFLICYHHEPRSLWLGLSFMTAVLGLLGLSAILLLRLDSRPINIAVFLGAALAVIALMTQPVAAILSLLTSGIRLIRREGFSLSNSLAVVLGIVYVLYLAVWPLLRGRIGSVFFDFVYTYLSFCFVLTASVFAVYTVTNLLNLIPRRGRRYRDIIVLGCGLRRDGLTVTPLLAGRVDKGIEAYRQNPGSLLVLSGGQGDDEKIAEGEAMKNYAIEQGVPERDIIVENRSTSTHENLLFSRELMAQNGRGEGHVLVVTTKYHVLRALLLAKKMGLPCDGRGSKTKLYFSINAFVREWIAYLVLYKRSYIILLLIGLVVIAGAYLL